MGLMRLMGVMLVLENLSQARIPRIGRYIYRLVTSSVNTRVEGRGTRDDDEGNRCSALARPRPVKPLTEPSGGRLRKQIASDRHPPTPAGLPGTKRPTTLFSLEWYVNPSNRGRWVCQEVPHEGRVWIHYQGQLQNTGQLPQHPVSGTDIGPQAQPGSG
jgi:hypothetical protein